ncbi:hypothetical protein [Acidianus two-tailed virus 2]|nr:hypothetical protein [Acidianus two-tailed virus 2]
MVLLFAFDNKTQESEQQDEDPGTRTKEEQENVISIYKNINFLKKIFEQSKKDGVEYLVVLGKNFADYYRKGVKGAGSLAVRGGDG